jgi:hypothetical protein
LRIGLQVKTPLLDIEFPSIYFRNATRQLLPTRMAKCTPDMYKAIMRISDTLEVQGGKLYLSDLFRSYDMQFQAHLDWKTGKKSAYSPPPGASMHEAGRAFDLDLSALKIGLSAFWTIAAARGISPIIAKADTKLSEAWHFDCRGSHALVYDYYKLAKGKNFSTPYAAMAASGINAVGISLDYFGSRQAEASIQFGLVRLGFELGGVDGNIGQKTRSALDAAGIPFGDLESVLESVEDLLQKKYPDEYAMPAHLDLLGQSDISIPAHLTV